MRALILVDLDNLLARWTRDHDHLDVLAPPVPLPGGDLAAWDGTPLQPAHADIPDTCVVFALNSKTARGIWRGQGRGDLTISWACLDTWAVLAARAAGQDTERGVGVEVACTLKIPQSADYALVCLRGLTAAEGHSGRFRLVSAWTWDRGLRRQLGVDPRGRGAMATRLYRGRPPQRLRDPLLETVYRTRPGQLEPQDAIHVTAPDQVTHQLSSESPGPDDGLPGLGRSLECNPAGVTRWGVGPQGVLGTERLRTARSGADGTLTSLQEGFVYQALTRTRARARATQLVGEASLPGAILLRLGDVTLMARTELPPSVVARGLEARTLSAGIQGGDGRPLRARVDDLGLLRKTAPAPTGERVLVDLKSYPRGHEGCTMVATIQSPGDRAWWVLLRRGAPAAAASISFPADYAMLGHGRPIRGIEAELVIDVQGRGGGVLTWASPTTVRTRFPIGAGVIGEAQRWDTGGTAAVFALDEPLGPGEYATRSIQDVVPPTDPLYHLPLLVPVLSDSAASSVSGSRVPPRGTP